MSVKRKYMNLPQAKELRIIPNPVSKFGRIILSLYVVFLASIRRLPGIKLHYFVYKQLLVRTVLGKKIPNIKKTAWFPMDSVRYYEFGFIYEKLKYEIYENYLDVSSPRLIIAALVSRRSNCHVTIVNPDASDLAITKNLFAELGIDERSEFVNRTIEEANLSPNGYDLITCVSVIEHIAGDGDKKAIQILWRSLRAGGKLLITVPCSKYAYEEYIDYNEYGLLDADENGYVFGQRFYDNKLIQDVIYSITGSPDSVMICGEKERGLFYRNRDTKLSEINYRSWYEPKMMMDDYDVYESIDSLPGIGVISMVFKKPIA